MADQQKVQIPLELVDQFGDMLKKFTKGFISSMKKSGSAIDKAAKKAEQQKKKFEKMFKAARKGADDFNKSLNKLALGFAAASAAFTKMADRAATIGPVVSGFDSLTKSIGATADVMLGQMQAATNGLIDNYTLMQKANNAIVLGVAESSKQFSELASGAVKLGQAMGLDAVSSIDSLVTGIGRQSAQILDNLAITVKAEEAYKTFAAQIGKTAEKLTASERKLAFNQAAIEGIRKAVEKLGNQELPTDAWTQAVVRLKNAFDNFLQSDFFVSGLTFITDNFQMLIEAVVAFIALKIGAVMTNIGFAVAAMIPKIQAATTAFIAMGTAVHVAAGAIGIILGLGLAIWLANTGKEAENAAKKFDEKYTKAIDRTAEAVKNLSEIETKATIKENIKDVREYEEELIELEKQIGFLNKNGYMELLENKLKFTSLTEMERKEIERQLGPYRLLKKEQQEVTTEMHNLIFATDDLRRAQNKANKETETVVKNLKKTPILMREQWVMLMNLVPLDLVRLRTLKEANDAMKRHLPGEKELNEILKERANIPLKGGFRDFDASDLFGLNVGEKIRKEARLAGLKTGDAFMKAFGQSMQNIGDIGKATSIAFGTAFSVELNKTLTKLLGADFFSSTLGRFVDIGIPIIGQLISNQLSKIGGMILNAFSGPTNEQLIENAGRDMAKSWGAAWTSEVQSTFDRIARNLASTTKTGKANVLMAGFSPEVLQELLKNVTSFALEVQNKLATSIGHGVNMWREKLGLTLKQAFETFVPVLEGAIGKALEFGERLSPQILNLITHARNLGVEFKGLQKIFEDALDELLSSANISVERLELIRETGVQVGVELEDAFQNIFKKFLLDTKKSIQEIVGVGIAAQQAGFQINNGIIAALSDMFPKTEAANAGILRMLQIAKELGSVVDNDVQKAFLSTFKQIIRDGGLTTQQLIEIARAASDAGINLKNSFGRAIKDARSDLRTLRGQLKDMNMSIVDSFVGGIEMRKQHQEQWQSWLKAKKEELMVQWRKDNKELLEGLTEEQIKQLEIQEGEKARIIAQERIKDLRDLANKALEDGKITQKELAKLTEGLSDEEKLIVGNLVQQKLERKAQRKELKEQAKEQRQIEKSIKLQRDMVKELRALAKQSAKGGLLGDSSESAKVREDIHKAQQDWKWMVNHPLPQVRVGSNVPASDGFEGIVSGPASGFQMPITAHGTERVSIQPLSRTTNVNSGGNMQLSVDKIIVPEGTNREQVDHIISELHSRISSGTTPFRTEPRTGAIKLN